VNVTYMREKEDIPNDLLSVCALERYRLRRIELPLAFSGRAARTKRRQRKRTQTNLVSENVPRKHFVVDTYFASPPQTHASSPAPPP